MDNNLVCLFQVELIIVIVGFSLFVIEFKKLFHSIKSDRKNSEIIISLLGILFFSNFIYLMRTIGIFTNNIAIRQLGAAVSVLITEIFLINWGSFATNIRNDIRHTLSLGILIGSILFIVGTFFDNILFIVSGVLVLAVFPVGMIIWLFVYVFGKSPYIFAKQRIFLMSLSLSLIIVLEGFAVTILETNHYRLSTLIFLFELPVRILMTMSIILPKRIQKILLIIIK